jgi:hypothetical protein
MPLKFSRLTAILGISLLIVSCARFGSEEDAANFIQSALEKSSGGLGEDWNNAAQYAASPFAANCGQNIDTTLNFSLVIGERKLDAQYNWQINPYCESGTITGFDWVSNYTTEYEGPRLFDDATGTRTWSLRGVGSIENWFTLNGTSARNSVIRMKTGFKRTYNAELTGTFTNILLHKQTRRVVGGLAEYLITLWEKPNQKKDYTAEITFGENGLVSLFINGEDFSFSMY